LAKGQKFRIGARGCQKLKNMNHEETHRLLRPQPKEQSTTSNWAEEYFIGYSFLADEHALARIRTCVAAS